MRSIIAAIAVACSVGHGTAYAADEKQPAWAGIWAGTIGDEAVRLCLVDKHYSAITYGGRGSYYRMNDRVAHTLEQQAPSLWVETAGGSPDATDPVWTVDTFSKNILSAHRTVQGRVQPVQLKRLSTDSDCGSDIYLAPRFGTMKQQTEAAEIDGVRYRKLTASAGDYLDIGIEGFELIGDSAGIQAVNAQLRTMLPLEVKDNIAFECISAGQNQNGRDGDYAITIAPVLITRAWVSATVASGGYCGGAHPSYGTDMVAFDLRDGKKVDLYSWLMPHALGKSDYPDFKPLSADFRTFIMSYWVEDPGESPECKDAASQEDSWDIGLGRKGIIFTPWMAHAMMPCVVPVVVPFAKMQPYLNAAGKTAVASVEAGLQ